MASARTADGRHYISARTPGVINVCRAGRSGSVQAQAFYQVLVHIFTSTGNQHHRAALSAPTPQTLPVYNTYTDASNFERAMLDWTTTSNVLTIGAEKLGSGTLRTVKLVGSDITVKGNTATPAGGSTTARLLFGTTSGFGIYYGSGAPTVSAASGSIYIRTDNAGASLRLYSNTTGSTTWAAITSA